MAYLRWLHKSWNIFWTFIGVLVLSVAFVFGAIFGLMQLQPVKEQAVLEIEERFSQNFEGVVKIGKLDGLLPLNIELSDVKIYPDSSALNPVLETQSINVNIDVWSLLKNQLVINSLQIKQPNGIVDFQSDYSLVQAFRLKPSAVIKNQDLAETGSDLGFQIIIPSLNIEEGNIKVRNVNARENRFAESDSLSIKGISMSMFFEYTREQRFIDIDRFKFQIPELDIPEVELFGQIYNDDRFLELNAINIKTGKSSIRFSGEAAGVNFLDGKFDQQLANSSLSLLVNKFSIEPQLLSTFIVDAPKLSENLEGTFNGEGSLDSFNFNDIELTLGESFANLTGEVKDLRKLPEISYDLNLEAVIVGQKELNLSSLTFTDQQKDAITNTRFEGNIAGDIRSANTNIKAISKRGIISLQGNAEWKNNLSYHVSFDADSLDIGNLFTPQISKTDLTFSGEIKSTALNFKQSKGGLVIQSNGGTVEGRTFNQVSILANWNDGFIEPDIRIGVNGSLITSNGWIDLKSGVPELTLQGSARDITINDLITDERLNNVVADIEYDVHLKGTSLDDFFGEVSLDIPQAIAGKDTLGRHQLYVDLNDPDSDQRILRFTSTAFDLTIEGNYQPTNLSILANQWEQYFSNRIKEEFLFDTTEQQFDSLRISNNQNMVITARVKNLPLLNSYLPEIPIVESSARLNSTVNVNSDRILFNGTLIDNKTTGYGFKGDSLVMQVTGGFRREAKLKEFSGLQLRLQAAHIDYGYLDAKNFELAADLNQDSIDIRNSIKQLADDASFEFRAKGKLADKAITLNLLNFDLGSNSYRWRNQGEPLLKYESSEKLIVKDFYFESEEQVVQMNGTFSSSPEDSVNYNIGEVDLHKISQLIDLRLDFGGFLNGQFTTRTLTTVPTIQGDIDIETFNIDGRLFGDIILSSKYNAVNDRFDTKVKVTTDSAKYPEYYAGNERKGQEFDINGYFMTPVDGNFPDADSLYRFDIDFKNIDLWILPYIGPRIFAEGAGLANGKGKIWGNLDTYDFWADFFVGENDAAYLRPQFLDTYYYAQGRINFTKDDGFTFDDIYLIDPSGGNAILSGYYDLNFTTLDSMNIRLDMDEFQFLNSRFDPSLAFFGIVYGSSSVNISGTNINPVLRTEQPINISDFSEISIPLLEETEFDEDNRFIRFVDSFEPSDIQNGRFTSNLRSRYNSTSTDIEPEELSFAERFTMDLQFVANNPMTVRLIFDPVTGDIVTADGTGRLRILLEDEEVSMFGRFDIQGGRYQFVSGDIFTRRFELESGGTIIWEGDPENARLNLNAIYSARPDINTLSSTGARDPENSQRVPVDLVLNIGGTITSIENDFFFRLPSTFESQQSSTLSTQLASINRDEDLKLLQAANFMLMGDFIPVSSSGAAQGNLLGENLSGSAAVLNPLLSSQVINPLLSNQVNSLLNSDLSSLDVDFNLNTYNQVDLGVALRLYNDKLILRREGQITGRQSNIGDLGATYRINRTFAVTAFHRQDLTFGTLNSTEQSQQSQDINGVGLEAKVSFNTWEEFFKRLFSPVRKLFGIQDEEKQEEITEHRQGNNPI